MTDEEELARLIDGYRDESLNADDAKKLSEIIRSHDNSSDWVFEELALSGLLTNIMDSRDSHQFTETFQKRLAESAKEKQCDQDLRKKSINLKAIFPLLILQILLTIFAVYFLIYKSPLAQIKPHASGAILTRNEETTQLKTTENIFSHDNIFIPLKGSADLIFSSNFKLHLKSESSLEIEQNKKQILLNLENGSILVNQAKISLKKTNIYLLTPQVRIQLNHNTFEVQIIKEATILYSMDNEIQFEIIESGEMMTLPKNQRIKISDRNQ